MSWFWGFRIFTGTTPPRPALDLLLHGVGDRLVKPATDERIPHAVPEIGLRERMAEVDGGSGLSSMLSYP